MRLFLNDVPRASSSLSQVSKAAPQDVDPILIPEPGREPAALGISVASAPLTGIFNDVPDSFFSDDDFEIPLTKRASLPKTTAKPEAIIISDHASSGGPDIKSHDSPTNAVIVHDSMTRAPPDTARAPPNTTMSPPIPLVRQERIVPQASRADLMAEKGRISMEICDLMDLVELGVASPEHKSKLDELKARR